MEAYLVGGAVRDELLGYPVKERDWVVTGTTPEVLIELGYKQVGQDFPVFLHPETREEYALARTERQSGRGYRGFKFNYDPTVTLEEDLKRRDLTINAMAKDSKGKIIDPYGGKEDLKLKLLRHISPAFVEDPVRVLRVARFAARYFHLGFRLANETRLLMYEMLKKGEIDYLVPERVWQEWQRSLEEKNPEIFITTLRACGAARVIFPEIHALFGVPNSRHHHPEVDSGIHSLFALKEAVQLSKDPIVRFASLVHDLGKAMTPIEEWPRHINHSEQGLLCIKSLGERLRIPSNYLKFAALVSRYHLKIHAFSDLRASTMIKTLEKTDAFRRPELFEKLLIVCEADAKAAGKKEYKQADKWRSLLDACAKISIQEIINQGCQGKKIQEALHQKRIKCAKLLMENQ